MADDTAPVRTSDVGYQVVAVVPDGDIPPSARSLVPLLSPAQGVPPLVTGERGLVDAAQALAAGGGPVAIDAERASGYRYGQRAFLVQLRREGSGTWLLDPIALPDLSPVATAVNEAEWVLHAATQDLPCLAEVGLRPQRLFDTELGARLAGLPRVGLGAVVEHYLGLSLAKEHSAVDWSTRPLPESWLRYAALDVELLGALRDAIAADLAEQGKLDWAAQEFAALLSFAGPPVRVDPWRRTSGMHQVRTRRGAALVRELWRAREQLARERDVSPGRIVSDSVLVALAQRVPRSPADLDNVPGGRTVRRYQRHWLAAVRRASALAEGELPQLTLRAEGPPPARAWADRDPLAAARLATARELLSEFAAEHHLPVENLLSPDALRRLLWEPPTAAAVDAVAGSAASSGVDAGVAAVAELLRALDARPWQVEIAAPLVATAIAAHPG